MQTSAARSAGGANPGQTFKSTDRALPALTGRRGDPNLIDMAEHLKIVLVSSTASP